MYPKVMDTGLGDTLDYIALCRVESGAIHGLKLLELLSCVFLHEGDGEGKDVFDESGTAEVCRVEVEIRVLLVNLDEGSIQGDYELVSDDIGAVLAYGLLGCSELI